MLGLHTWFENRYFIKKAGYVADFCKICRKNRRFQLLQLNYQFLVFYIPVFGTKINGYFKTGLDCMTRYEAEPSIYPVLCRRLEPLEDMLRSLPKPTKESDERLAIENLIINSPASISHDLRMKLIREPFFILSPEVDSQLKLPGLESTGFFMIIATQINDSCFQ